MKSPPRSGDPLSKVLPITPGQFRDWLRSKAHETLGRNRIFGEGRICPRTEIALDSPARPVLDETMIDALQLTTPALLFPAISLLFLSYNNRFLTLANRVRSLHTEYRTNMNPSVYRQIENLRFRLILMRLMQWLGVLSFFLCVVCMLLLLIGIETLAWWLFGFALVLLMGSLGVALAEIQISVGALKVLLSDLES